MSVERSENIVVALAQSIAVRCSDLRAAGSFSGRELTLSIIDHPARGLGADRPAGPPSGSRPAPLIWGTWAGVASG